MWFDLVGVSRYSNEWKAVFLHGFVIVWFSICSQLQTGIHCRQLHWQLQLHHIFLLLQVRWWRLFCRTPSGRPSRFQAFLAKPSRLRPVDLVQSWRTTSKALEPHWMCWWHSGSMKIPKNKNLIKFYLSYLNSTSMKSKSEITYASFSRHVELGFLITIIWKHNKTIYCRHCFL